MNELSLDAEVVQEYLAECREHLATIETDLLAMEQGGQEIDEKLVNRVFRAAHCIKGGAGFLDLENIRNLAHSTEGALDLIRSRKLSPSPEVVNILLLSFDKLRELIQNHSESNQSDIRDFVSALAALSSAMGQQAEPGRQPALDGAGNGVGSSPSAAAEEVKQHVPVPAPATLPKAVSRARRTSRPKETQKAAAAPEPSLPIPAPPTPVSPVSSGPETAAKSAPSAPAPPAETTIRLNVALLDSLMTLAGELVLSRNQLNESLARSDERGIRSGAQRVSLVTSELQEVVTQTRMQPVGSLFGKFPRLVRDLSRELGKDVQLKIEGGEVEIDKTILEGLSDPLTHMIRNAVDHGIEPLADRIAAGKTAEGTVTLRASHQAGQVVIEIADDGKGLAAGKIAASALAKGLVTREQLLAMSERQKMALIFHAGVSTAEKLSDVSGRGVGMDVVKTNLDRLGGKIEIDSTIGKGSRFRIKLPLTLAIIPSLLVSNGGQRLAIPQVSVGELIRIPSAQIAQRTDKVGEAAVLNLRDRMVPLVRLSDALGAPPSTGAQRALNVVLVDTGVFEYGLAVEELHDTVEIVVKPLGRHLKGIPDYAGATILGDGKVAVILDVAGLAARVGLTAATAEALLRQAGGEETEGERSSMLLFQNAPGEMCAVPIEQVTRIERVRPSQIEYLGGRRTMQYRGAIMPVLALGDAASVGQLNQDQRWVVIVFENLGSPLGLLAAEPLDMVHAAIAIDTVTLRQPGVAGSAVFKERTILVVDIFELAETALPEWVRRQKPAAAVIMPGGNTPTVLVADDSDFFRGQVQRLIETAGCRVLPAEDGQVAWELLQRHAGEIDLVATDVEMPRLDGLALARQIRSDSRFRELPIIALSSLAGEEDIARGLAAGVNEYQVKLDREVFTESIVKALHGRAPQPAAAR